MTTTSENIIIENFDYEVEVIEHAWIPLSDGVKLSVKLWKPRPKTPKERFPVVLEAIPYRKDDVSLWDDSVRMAYVAGHGYICARLDLRGSGDSEGTLIDEYSTREQCDLVEAIDWLSRLGGSNGAVGMTGISWSGFNSLQVAAHRPPALKAIITVCSTDDRYDNDVHYMGGSILGFYQSWWGSIMHEFNIRPADPRIVGDAWEPMLRERMGNNPHLTSIWLTHQPRDDYWRPGSVCEDYSRIECPVLAVGGWADAYTDAIVRLVEHDTALTKGIIGPWGHTWPERSVPGPSIGFLQECLRWWDRWLKDIENGVEDDPQMRFYLQEPCALTPSCDHRDGNWLQSDDFLAGRPKTVLTLDTSKALLDAEGTPAEENLVSHSSPLTCGTQVDTWLPMGSPIDLPSEQTPDDERSLCFDSAPLAEDIELVGLPHVRLRIGADTPEAFVFARLCDVWPDGSSHLITRGNLNLTHRNSHEFPEALEPGEFYDVGISLKAVAQRIPAGHRVRLALSTSYWPWIWPNRTRATITIDAPSSNLILPMRSSGDVPMIRSFLAPEMARGEECIVEQDGKAFSRRDYDPATGVMTYTRSADDDIVQVTPSGMHFETMKSTSYIINENDPLSARMETQRASVFSRGDWSVRTEVFSVMACTFDDFIVTTETKVFLGEKKILDENHTDTIERCFN